MYAISSLRPDTSWLPLRPYWEALARHELAFPQCTRCGRFQWYPRVLCAACIGWEFRWTPVTPRGHVFGFSIVRRVWLPDAKVPYTVCTVEIDAAPGVLLICNLADEAQCAEVAVAAPVIIEFLDVEGATPTQPSITMPFARIG
jgi:uncharacterized OB-fold protein